MRSTLLTLAKFAVGIGLLYILYLLLDDPAILWQQMVDADKRLLVIGGFCYAFAVGLSGIKWGILLRSAGIHVRLGKLFSYQWLAEFFNNFLPAQVGGDVMRGYALAADTQRRAAAAASVIIDRFIGLLVFMLAAAVAASAMLLYGRPSGDLFSPEQAAAVGLIALGSGGASLLLIFMLIAMLSRRLKRRAEQLLQRLPFSARTVPLWHKLAEAFNLYRYSYRAMLWTACSSAVIVLVTSINIWLIARAIQPDSITLMEVLAINPIIVFVALIIPLSPGGLGVRQGAFGATFLLMGAGGDLGVAVGLLQQFIAYIVSLPGAFLWMRGVGSRRPPEPAPLPTDS
ncbi:MAG: lysylphosphatidylglycerol synthase transmembrane domain-containing protein [Litorilinea sp.]